MKNIIAVAAVFALTGCASITGERTQSIMVQTIHENAEIAGSGCTLSNDAGSWFVTTPSSVVVHKSTGDLTISCKKNALAGNQTLESKSNINVWGNVIAGGVIGYVVDRNTGAGFNYPTTAMVMMRRIGDETTPTAAATPPAP